MRFDMTATIIRPRLTEEDPPENVRRASFKVTAEERTLRDFFRVAEESIQYFADTWGVPVSQLVISEINL